MIALQVGEVGELSEIFQWRGDAVANGLVGFSSEDKRHVGEEMSDVSPLLPSILAGHPILEESTASGLCTEVLEAAAMRSVVPLLHFLLVVHPTGLSNTATELRSAWLCDATLL